MPVAIERTNKFLNCREWRSFLSAAQAVSYPSVVRALEAGQAWVSGRTWFSDAAAKTSCSLLVESGLAADSRKTLGI